MYWYYKQWREAGFLDTISDQLHAQIREQAKKKLKWITLIIVDSQATKNTCNASVSDDQGLIEMFEANIDYFKSKPVNIPKITVMVDHGYNPEYLTKELEKIYSQIMTKIRFKVAPKMSKHEKKS